MAATDDAFGAAAPGAESVRTQYRKLTPGPGRSAADVAFHQRARIFGAMIQIVASRGYSAVRVRDLVGLAGVSSRTFYENFETKEECFLRAYEAVTRRASQRIFSSQEDEPDWRQRPLLVFEALARELESDPAAARFAMIEAHEAGPAALELAQQAEDEFGAMLAQSFARAPGGIVVPPLVVQGIVGGVGGVARARVLVGREEELAGLGNDLIQWALACTGKSARTLASLDRGSMPQGTSLESRLGAGAAERGARLSPGERGMILASVAQLAVAIGYDKLTITRIRTGAKVSRKAFDANFKDAEECFLAALELRADETLAHVARAQAAGRTWPGSTYRGIAAVCDLVADDPFLAMACLANPFAEGSAGDRSRRRLAEAIADRLGESVPSEFRPAALHTEASYGAFWALFRRHILGDRSQRQIAATLAFLTLAPVIGATAAVAAIRREQEA